MVSLCWANGLYDAILYIYNRGMLDYTTPLEELLAVLRQAVNTGKQLTGKFSVLSSGGLNKMAAILQATV